MLDNRILEECGELTSGPDVRKMLGPRDILVLLDASGSVDSRIDVAVGIARRFGARLTGLYVATYPQLYRRLDSAGERESFEAQVELSNRSIAAVEERFRRRVGTDSAKFVFKSEIRPSAQLVSVAAGYAGLADLTVTTAPGRHSVLGGGFVDDFVLSVGGPVLFVPPNFSKSPIGFRIMVGWDGSRAATRALNDSWPFLESAEQVTLLSVETASEKDLFAKGDVNQGWISKQLGHHRVNATLRRSFVNERHVGEVILTSASRADADMLVSGAEGRSRLRTTVIGGVTAYLLRNSTVPVLMSH